MKWHAKVCALYCGAITVCVCEAEIAPDKLQWLGKGLP